VAIFGIDGSVKVATKTGQELNISLRDMPIFNTTTYPHKHATIAIREARVLVRTVVVRALLYHDKMLLFECQHVPTACLMDLFTGLWCTCLRSH
jgi:hypothetical protein